MNVFTHIRLLDFHLSLTFSLCFVRMWRTSVLMKKYYVRERKYSILSLNCSSCLDNVTSPGSWWTFLTLTMCFRSRSTNHKDAWPQENKMEILLKNFAQVDVFIFSFTRQSWQEHILHICPYSYSQYFLGKCVRTLKINQRELIHGAPKWKYHSQLGNKNKMLQSVSLNAMERASVPATGTLSYFIGWIFI